MGCGAADRSTAAAPSLTRRVAAADVQTRRSARHQMTTTLKALAFVALAAGTAACGGLVAHRAVRAASQESAALEARPGTQTIVGIVVQEDGEFDVLRGRRSIRAGLAETLAGNAASSRCSRPPTPPSSPPSAWPTKRAAIAAVNGLAPRRRSATSCSTTSTSGRRNSTSVLAAPGYQMLNGKTLPRTAAAGRRDRADGHLRLERDRPRDQRGADPGRLVCRADPGRAATRRGVSARRGLSTSSCRTSASVRPAAFSAGTNVVKSVSKARNSPPSGSPT